MNPTPRLLFASLLMVATTACGDAPAPPHASTSECDTIAKTRPPAYDGLDFFGKLTFGSDVDYARTASLQALASKAERVFVGKLTAVVPGNLYSQQGGMGGVRCERGVRHTTNLIFDVSQDVRGGGPTQVTVEWTHSRVVFTSDLAPIIPAQEMLVFLNSFRSYPPPVGAAPGALDREFSYFQTSLGLVTTVGDGLGFPLETDRGLWLPLVGETVRDVAGSLRLP